MEAAGFSEDEVRDAVYAAGEVDTPTLDRSWKDELSSRGHGIASAMEDAGFSPDEVRDAVYAAGEIDSPTQTGTWMDQLSPQEHGVARRAWARNDGAIEAIKDAMDKEPKLIVTLPQKAQEGLIDSLFTGE